MYMHNLMVSRINTKYHNHEWSEIQLHNYIIKCNKTVIQKIPMMNSSQNKLGGVNAKF